MAKISITHINLSSSHKLLTDKSTWPHFQVSDCIFEIWYSLHLIFMLKFKILSKDRLFCDKQKQKYEFYYENKNKTNTNVENNKMKKDWFIPSNQYFLSNR